MTSEKTSNAGGKVLEIDGLNAGYNGVAVVRNFSLQIKAGEVVALLGPNGAGKSTILKTISGLVPAISGQVIVCGKPVPDFAKAHTLFAAGVVHVPEDRGVFFQLTVKENLTLARSGNLKASIAEAVDLFPALGPLMDRKCGLLSGGEQQMLTLARAVIARPALLIIDELSLGLAPVIYRQLVPMVRRFSREIGCAVLFVEQHIDLALAEADIGYVLYHGDTVMKGNALELLLDREALDNVMMGRPVGALL